MSDTERSDQHNRAYSAPLLVDLDDHRHQHPIPRADTMSSQHSGTHTRRPTLASIHLPDPQLLGVHESLEGHDITTRDFECAILEDGNSALGSPTLDVSRGPPSPNIARRSTLRRTSPRMERPNHSRESSTSSRASRPTSVEAFADARRRQRAGTATSNAPSHIGEHLFRPRTNSNGTNAHAPTVTATEKEFDTESTRSSVEEDVCYPQSEEGESRERIDYEELDELVEKCRQATMDPDDLAEKVSSAMNHGASAAGIPTVVTEPPTPDRRPSELVGESSEDIENEKVHTLARTPTRPTHLSTSDSESQEERKPQMWTYFSTELEDTIHATNFAGLLSEGESPRDLFTLANPDKSVWWLDVMNATDDEVFRLCKGFNIHPLTREDIDSLEPREKVELFSTYYFVSFKSFKQTDKEADDYLDPVNVYVVVFREGLLTFTFAPNPHASNVRKRIGRLREYINLTPDWCCYAMIDDIVDSFGPSIHDVELRTQGIEDSIFTARMEDSREVLRTIGEERKTVMQLLRLLGGKADVIKGFAKRCNEGFEVAPRGDIGLYLGDVQDHVLTMVANLGHNEKMLSRSHSNYLAQINVDNIQAGNKVNETLGKITLVATILVPLNVITGLFGMNVPVPGKNAESLNWFFGILGLIIGLVAVFLAWARFRRMI
ncbi:cora-domain-containing protein [Aulographum hederae CBS 113979]|uniref:Cora-domain-containing protein n=1 Tax=Aulographum hederae CBS 113979 TaxID=1176131 RepID=A0A6G1GLG7_9PEZI|nr:cora-domain-containing protein [Aulographum hederae CBS 113979]